jgi:hypothetical protein
MHCADPVSLYIITQPNDKDRLRPLVRIVVNMIVRRLADKMEFQNGRPKPTYKHKLLAMIDEFPTLRKLEILQESLAFVAGYGIKCYLISQDINQLKSRETGYLKIAHGYATTSHSSQGLTANFAVVFGAAFDQKSLYVSHSRARERVDTYVPSKEAFLTRAERAQGERLGVLEAIANATKEQGGEMPQELKIGDEVNWLYEPRGGYGYVTPVAGMVTKIGPQKVQIRVAKRVDSQWVGVRRWVRPERLTRRVGSAGEAERILNAGFRGIPQAKLSTK